MSLKTINKISLKKFTNIALFERRERNNSEIKKQKKKFQIKLYKNQKETNDDNKINQDYNQILFSFYTFQTEGNTTHKLSKNLKNNVTTKSIFNKTTNNFKDTSFPFYITETIYNTNKPNNIYKKSNSRNKKLININKIKIINNNNNNNNYDDLIFQKNYKTYTNFNKYSKNKDKNEENNKEDLLINLKTNKLRAIFKDNYFNTKQYIAKTRKFLLMKYSSSVRNERKRRNEELIENKMEQIDDKMKSLKNLKGLYNQYFNHKLS